MRCVAIGLLLLAAAGCGASDDEGAKPRADVVPAAVTYDGANSTDPKSLLAHGERMSWMLGCKGCHGKDLQGKNVSADDPQYGDMNAPNLTLLLPQYGDLELDRAIRQGVARDGREMWFMASESFQFVSDADLSALIAYLRSYEPAGRPMPPLRKGPKYLAEIEQGLVANAPGMVKRFRGSTPVDLGDQHALGRYIAMTSCNECHNAQLEGYEGFSPNLDIVGAYSNAELMHLLRTGEGKARKDLGLMSMTARNRYSKLTEREMQAIVAYLKARADRPQ